MPPTQSSAGTDDAFLRRSDPEVTPVRIHADRPARVLHVVWADGHASAFDFTLLRWLCPCAYCRGEGGMPGWLDSAPVLTDVETTLTDVSLVGQYAVAPAWADGHHTGFYTFEALRAACPCADHETARMSAHLRAGDPSALRGQT